MTRVAHDFRRSLVLMVAVGLLVGCAGQNRPPVLLSAAPLEYPQHARESGVEGSVRVSYRVGVDGRVSNVQVIASEPAGVFDAAAMAAISAWRFSPALIEGQETAVEHRESTLTFRLGDTDQYRRE